MRRVLIAGGIAVAAIFLAVAAILLLVDVNQFRGRIQSELQARLNRPVSLGAMGLTLIPLSVRADDLTIGESPAFNSGRPFAAAKQLRVRVGILPLLRKEVRIDSLVLREPAIELVRSRDGKWNYSDLGGDRGDNQGGGAGAKGAGIALSLLRIEDGRLAVTDLASPKSRAVYEHIDITLRDFAPGKPLQLEAAVRLPEKGSVTLDAKGGPFGSASNPLIGRLSIRDADLAALLRVANSPAPGMDGSISGTTDFQSLGESLTARGALSIDKLRLRGADLGYPIKAEYDLTHDFRSGALMARLVDLNVGKLPIRASGTLNTTASSLDARVRVAEASLAELLDLARAFGAAGLSGSGIVSLDARVQGPLKPSDALAYSGTGKLRNASIRTAALTQPLEVRSADLRFEKNAATLSNLVCSLAGSTLRGTANARNFSSPEIGFDLDIDKLDIAALQQAAAPAKSGGRQASSGGGTPALSAKGVIRAGSILFNGIALEHVRSECSFNRGVLALAPLTADVFGGKQTGGITLDTRAQPATVALNTKLEAVDANRLLSATTSVKQMLYGLLSAGGNASMTLVPGGDAARTLNGNLNLHLAKGRLAGVNLLNELANVGKFIGYAQRSEPFTNIVQLAGDVVVRNGVASTDNLQLQIDGGTVASAGTVNLADQALNLRLTAVLNQEMSRKAGGTQIGGFLTTALANSKGELVIPALVTGTFARPRFMPDAARIAEMKMKNVLPAPAAAGARSILDSITGKQKPATSAPQSLFDTLDSLRRKPEKK